MTSAFRASISVTSSKFDAKLWHQRLKHMSEKRMKVMLSKDKLPRLKSIDLDFCEDCVCKKQQRVSFLKMRELVHTDVWDKASVPSLEGSLYFVTFINDSSRKVWIYFLKHKSNVVDVLNK